MKLAVYIEEKKLVADVEARSQELRRLERVAHVARTTCTNLRSLVSTAAEQTAKLEAEHKRTVQQNYFEKHELLVRQSQERIDAHSKEHRDLCERLQREEGTLRQAEAALDAPREALQQAEQALQAFREQHWSSSPRAPLVAAIAAAEERIESASQDEERVLRDVLPEAERAYVESNSSKSWNAVNGARNELEQARARRAVAAREAARLQQELAVLDEQNERKAREQATDAASLATLLSEAREDLLEEARLLRALAEVRARLQRVVEGSQQAAERVHVRCYPRGVLLGGSSFRHGGAKLTPRSVAQSP